MKNKEKKNAIDIRYNQMFRVFIEAYEQASKGKGDKRHADMDLSFEEQDIVRDAYLMGITGPVYQIRKKAKEACRLDNSKAKQELLGVIVYAAAAIRALEMKGV